MYTRLKSHDTNFKRVACIQLKRTIQNLSIYCITIVMKLECEGVVKNGNITYDLHQILCSVVGTVEP